MARGQSLAVLLVFSLVMNTFCSPAGPYRNSRAYKRYLDSKEVTSVDDENNLKSQDQTSVEDKSDFDDDDFDFNFDSPPPNAKGGSNIVSLLNIANALFPAFSGSNPNNKLLTKITNMIQNYIQQRKINLPNWKRVDLTDNKIEVAPKRAKTKYQLQESSGNSISSASQSQSDTLESLSESSESEDSESHSAELHKGNKSSDSNNVSENDKGSDSRDNASDSNEKTSDSSSAASENQSDDTSEENGAEISVEKENNKNDDDSHSKQDSGLDASNSSDDSDNDEPDGDGQDGGLLGILAKLSGGDGDSDLATLLSALGGIIANLSGDGVDLNNVISSSLGLLVGLLSGEDEHPGDTVASYLITTLETITEGGAKNNGLFFGKFLTKLLKGISAAENQDDEADENSPPKVDSAGFFISLLMGLLGDMSKSSSGGSSRSSSHGDKAELI